MAIKKLSFQIPPPTLDFADETVKKIESLISKSIHNEFGGVLCLDANNKIYLESVVKGEKEGIAKMPMFCEEGNRRIGSIHTHPKYDEDGNISVERISSGDYRFHERNDFITCIGHGSTKKLTCMVSGNRLKDEELKLEKLIDELGEAEVYWQMLGAVENKKEAEKEIKKEGHYDKINTYYDWLNVDMI